MIRSCYKTTCILLRIIGVVLLICVIALMSGLLWLSAKPREIPALGKALSIMAKRLDASSTLEMATPTLYFSTDDMQLTADIKDAWLRRDGRSVAMVKEAQLTLDMSALLFGDLQITAIDVKEAAADIRISGQAPSEVQDADPDAARKQYESIMARLVHVASHGGDVLPLRRISMERIKLRVRHENNGRISQTSMWKVQNAALKFDVIGRRVVFDGAVLGSNDGMAFNMNIDGLVARDNSMQMRVDFDNLPPSAVGSLFPVSGWLGTLKNPCHGNVTMMLSEYGEPAQVSFEIKTGREEAHGTKLDISGNMLFPPANDGVFEMRLNAQTQDIENRDLASLWPQAYGASARSWVKDNITEGDIKRAGIMLNYRSDKPHPFLSAFVEFEGTKLRFLEGLPSLTNADGVAYFSHDSMELELSRARFHSAIITGGDVDIYHLGAPYSTMRIKGNAAGDIADFKPFAQYFAPHGTVGYVDIYDTYMHKGQVEGRFDLAVPLNGDDVDFNISAYIKGFEAGKPLEITEVPLHVNGGEFNFRLNPRMLTVDGKALINDVPLSIAFSQPLGEVYGDTGGTRYGIDGYFNSGDMAVLGLPEMPFLDGDFGLTLEVLPAKSGDGLTINGLMNADHARLHMPILGIDKSVGRPASGRFHIDYIPKVTAQKVLPTEQHNSFSFKHNKPKAASEAKRDIAAARHDRVVLREVVLLGTTERDRQFIIQANGQMVNYADGFKRGWALESLHIPLMKYDFHHARFDVIYDNEENIYNISGHGKSLYLGGVISAFMGDDSAKDAAVQEEDIDLPQYNMPQYNMRFAFDRVVLQNNIVIDEFDTSLLCHIRTRCEFNYSGKFRHNNAPLTVYFKHVASDEKMRKKLSDAGVEITPTLHHFKFTTDDAGALIRGLGVYKEVRDGRLLLEGVADIAGKKGTGSLKLKDFELLEAPVFTKILSLASLSGIISIFREEGMVIDRMAVDFSYDDAVVNLKDVNVKSSVVVLTMKGKVGYAPHFLDVAGTVAPASIISRIVGGIPLVGEVLTGTNKEGLFAARFSAKGKYPEPDISVNALSALTPGILRDLWGDPD